MQRRSKRGGGVLELLGACAGEYLCWCNPARREDPTYAIGTYITVDKRSVSVKPLLKELREWSDGMPDSLYTSAADRIAELEKENVDLHEQVAYLQSREVCAAAHE